MATQGGCCFSWCCIIYWLVWFLQKTHKSNPTFPLTQCAHLWEWRSKTTDFMLRYWLVRAVVSLIIVSHCNRCDELHVHTSSGSPVFLLALTSLVSVLSNTVRVAIAVQKWLVAGLWVCLTGCLTLIHIVVGWINDSLPMDPHNHIIYSTLCILY